MNITHRASVFAVATALVASSFMSTDTHASAPMVKKSAPGYYRIMLGDFEITALSDGTVPLPVDKLLTNTTPEKVTKALTKYYLKSPLETSVNTYLINTGTKLVMVDTGAAGLFGPTLGNLLTNLKASGYEPEQIDEIYITHMHGDHVGGLMAGDKIAFPNAVVRGDQHDADFWLSEANMNKAAAGDKGGFQGAMASVNPYVKAGKYKILLRQYRAGSRCQSFGATRPYARTRDVRGRKQGREAGAMGRSDARGSGAVREPRRDHQVRQR